MDDIREIVNLLLDENNDELNDNGHDEGGDISSDDDSAMDLDDDRDDSDSFLASESEDDPDIDSQSSLSQSSEDSRTSYSYQTKKPDYVTDEGYYLFAARKNDIELMKEMIDEGFNLNDNILGSFFCLHEAIKECHFTMVELLLDAGANLSCVDSQGQRPIHTATNIGDRGIRWKMVRLLLNAGASVNDENLIYRVGYSCKTTCIHQAVKIHDFDLVLLFLGAGANINCFDNYGNGRSKETPLHVALGLKKQAQYEMVRKLIAAGSDVNLSDDGHSCLHRAIAQEECSWELVQILLNAGAQLNCVSQSRLSPLSIAVQWHNESLVKKMIEAGADVNISKDCYMSPLYVSCSEFVPQKYSGYAKKNQANPSVIDDDGINILYPAMSLLNSSQSYKELDIIRILVDNGAEIHNTKFGEYSPVKILLAYGSMEALDMFIHYGLKLKDCGVRFPLHEAAMNPHAEILQYVLQSYLFDVDEIDDGGMTSLLIAIRWRREHNVRLLLEWGANVKVGLKDCNSWSPTDINSVALSEAFFKIRPELSRPLFAAGAIIHSGFLGRSIQHVVRRVMRHSSGPGDFIRYLAVLVCQGYSFNPSDARYLMEKIPGFSGFFMNFLAEINDLKTHVLHGSVTMYNVLMWENITRYIDNPCVHQKFESLAHELHHYGPLIEEFYSLSLVRRKVMYVASISMHKIFGSRFCGGENFFTIVAQLSIKDLRSLSAV
ncbi:hypothetical protein QAD02_019249 [Eretmocerus hayati]|uniref:Uncharacterized protein n=1 Tax=Eretmocerus hayati TaxID=131215 RepID=A0ACC2PM92_9HYME|nr:hypothetical protein QAD02_019249 [Eretmocerus hayati]